VLRVGELRCKIDGVISWSDEDIDLAGRQLTMQVTHSCSCAQVIKCSEILIQGKVKTKFDIAFFTLYFFFKLDKLYRVE